MRITRQLAGVCSRHIRVSDPATRTGRLGAGLFGLAGFGEETWLVIGGTHSLIGVSTAAQ
jgi:hypothetical protein